MNTHGNKNARPVGREPCRTLEAPTGLEYYARFISTSEEQTLLTVINTQPWEQAGNAPRRVQQYGFKYEHALRELSSEGAQSLPAWLEPLVDRIVTLGMIEPAPHQVIINEYLPGQGIRPHVDHPQHFGPTVVSISLGSGAIMRFTSLSDPTIVKDIFLEPGSLVALSGESRYRWRHEIPSRAVDQVGEHEYARSRRISITLRTVAP